MRDARTFRFVLLAAAAALALLALPAQADYKQAYKAGYKAFDQRNWSDAARFMRQAIAEQPNESADKLNIYGMIYEPYLPHYYLGIALKESGDCQGALQELTISDQQGAVRGTDYYGKLTKAVDACRKQLPVAAPTAAVVAATAVPSNLGPSIQKAEQAIGLASDAANALNALHQSADYAAAWQATPELAARSDQAARKLEQARSKLTLGRSQGNVVELEGAAGMAADAGRELQALKDLLTARRGELAQQQQTDAARRADEERKAKLIKDVNATLAEAKTVQALAAARQPASPDIQRQNAELARAISDSASLQSLTVAQLGELQGRIANATAVLKDTLARPAAAGSKPGPPAELRQAAQLFLAAEWSRLAQLLGALNLGEPKANATVALLRAAARFSLFVEGGEKAAGLRQQAEADIRTCRQLDAAVVPTAKAFSPRFVDFFQRVR